ncbi:hypothetical protein CDIK_0274 [Cucumispora dikerogammari]|nr:hypothetical protein CDIK_0274 [Cucumispora dikerogammari]
MYYAVFVLFVTNVNIYSLIQTNSIVSVQPYLRVSSEQYQLNHSIPAPDGGYFLGSLVEEDVFILEFQISYAVSIEEMTVSLFVKQKTSEVFLKRFQKKKIVDEINNQDIHEPTVGISGPMNIDLAEPIDTVLKNPQKTKDTVIFEQKVEVPITKTPPPRTSKELGFGIEMLKKMMNINQQNSNTFAFNFEINITIETHSLQTTNLFFNTDFFKFEFSANGLFVRIVYVDPKDYHCSGF